MKVGVAPFGRKEALVIGLLSHGFHAPRPRHLVKELILQARPQMLTRLPYVVDHGHVLVHGPLTAQVDRLGVTEGVGDDVMVHQLRPLDEPGQLAEDDVEVGVAPVRVVD